MARIEGLDKVVAMLKARAAKASQDKKVSVSVGYTTEYALWVHEMTNIPHKPPGVAKFLETPARLMKDELATTIKTAIQQGKTVAQALLLAGLKLQGASQRICPVDTGALRASAYTKLN